MQTNIITYSFFGWSQINLWYLYRIGTHLISGFKYNIIECNSLTSDVTPILTKVYLYCRFCSAVMSVADRLSSWELTALVVAEQFSGSSPPRFLEPFQSQSGDVLFPLRRPLGDLPLGFGLKTSEDHSCLKASQLLLEVKSVRGLLGPTASTAGLNKQLRKKKRKSSWMGYWIRHKYQKQKILFLLWKLDIVVRGQER